MSYFILPMAALAGVGLGLPKLMPIIMTKVFKKSVIPKASQSVGDTDDLLGELVTEGSTDAEDESGLLEGSQELPMDEEKPIDAIAADADKIAEKLDENMIGIDPKSLGGSGLGGIGEEKIRELIDQKFEPVEKDLASFKKDLNKIKEDMKITKESVDTLTESFEGTLTDMKAFQAEISNPLNFMRKYFESLDLKTLQDPSLPLRQQLRSEYASTESAPEEKQMITIPQVSPVSGQGATPTQSTQPSIQSPPTPSADLSGPSETATNPMDSVMKPLFSGKLSVGKMMSIVELAGDMLKEQGDDCIDLLLEQCKLMGLKPEDENTIFNIIDMLKNSGMNVEDTLMQLYKFSKIVGMNDAEADSHYSRLMANRTKQKLREGE